MQLQLQVCGAVINRVLVLVVVLQCDPETENEGHSSASYQVYRKANLIIM